MIDRGYRGTGRMRALAGTSPRPRKFTSYIALCAPIKRQRKKNAGVELYQSVAAATAANRPEKHTLLFCAECAKLA